MGTLWRYIQLLQISLLDVIEIAVVGYVIYRLLLLWSGTRAFQMLFGLVALLSIYAGAGWLGLGLIESILSGVFTYGAFALLIVFQPELRSALARLGRNRVFSTFARVGERRLAVADELARAALLLSQSRTGAIIALEQELSLEEYIDKTGTRLRAEVSAELLVSLFNTRAPLHDGAVIVRGDEIIAAGVHLPLARSELADKSLGTRHRATLGLAEETDALVIVVSEETSQISLARRGVLRRRLSVKQLRNHLAADVARPELGRPEGEVSPEGGVLPEDAGDLVLARPAANGGGGEARASGADDREGSPQAV